MPRIVAEGLLEMGLVCEAEAKENVVQVDAIDTGNLLNSIYTHTHRGEGQPSLATGLAYSRRLGEQISVQEDIYAQVEEVPEDEMEVFVKVAANYGIYVEMGTTRMAARAYLLPAFETTRLMLEKIMRARLEASGWKL